MEDKIVSVKYDKKEYKKWSKSISKNDFTKEIKVEEIENGFLVTTSEYGKKNGKEWTDDTKKYYSEENPLSDNDIEKGENITGVIDDFLKEF